MELFEEIRREDEFGTGTIQGVARKFGVHRRLVREALRTAVPTQKPTTARARPRLGPLVEFIEGILEADRRAPRQQRHTAHRIWGRLGQERPGPDGAPPVAESTVRESVRERKRALGLLARETFVPQSDPWGAEAQVDWYEADADLGEERVTLHVFGLRSMASGAAFHCASRHATQQAFREAHQRAFHYFGGVFRRLRSDNLPAAVKRVLRGARREETARFGAFRSPWGFQAEFCTPAEAHEKGGIENEIGTFRRNHWGPVPQAVDLAALNVPLLAACRADEARTLAGRSQSGGAALLVERAHRLPLAGEDFALAETSFPTVKTLGCGKVRTNSYSAPLPAGTAVQGKLRPGVGEIWHEGKRVAVHERCDGRFQEILDLEHDRDVLELKPGALVGSKPLEQWRQAGRWPPRDDQLWAALIERHGRPRGTREMIDLLRLGRLHGQARLRAAVEHARALGCADSGAVRHLVRAAERTRPRRISTWARSRASDGPAGGRRRRPAAGGGTRAMSETTTRPESVIRQHGTVLCLPTSGGQCASLAQQAKREHRTDLGDCDALLVAELEERERNTVSRRIREAPLPRLKTLEEFDFAQAPGVSPTRIQDLAQGDDIARAEPVVFIGESETGKTHSADDPA